jgi:hypothetical protein
MKRLLPLLLLAAAGLAHHSAASWDLSKRITISGQLKSVKFRNPHGALQIMVGTTPSKAVQWEIETSALNLLVRRGWKFDSVKAGDKVTLVGHPHKTQPNHLYLRELTLADGTHYGDPAGKDAALD